MGNMSIYGFNNCGCESKNTKNISKTKIVFY